MKPFIAHGGTLISHLFYADDVLIFSNGGKKSIHQLKATLKAYEVISGQFVSPSKSSIFFSLKIPLCRKLKGVAAHGFCGGSLALYLFGGAFACWTYDYSVV